MFDKLPDQSESETTSEEASRGTDPTKVLQLMTEGGQRCSDPTGGQIERPQSCPNGNLTSGDLNAPKKAFCRMAPGSRTGRIDYHRLDALKDQEGPATVCEVLEDQGSPATANKIAQ